MKILDCYRFVISHVEHDALVFSTTEIETTLELPPANFAVVCRKISISVDSSDKQRSLLLEIGS